MIKKLISYSLINRDSNFLPAFDGVLFAHTPLHIAAAEGRTQLALEIQRLMPSLGRKLNPNGLSPLGLALRRGHRETVRASIKLNPELVRVQEREGITPLHYAAAKDDVEILAEFLLLCPESINELTNRQESAAHVAVKNRMFAAFEVLCVWLDKTDRRDVLRWRDSEGNTVLHLAAYTNQTLVMAELSIIIGVELSCLLTGRSYFKDKNAEGLTALDIVRQLPTEVNKGRALEILRELDDRPSFISDSDGRITNFADYLRSLSTFRDKIIKLCAYLDIGLPGEFRNGILVVAVLIATATYQVVLSPPGGYSGFTVPNNSSATNTTSHTRKFLDGGISHWGPRDNDGNGKVVMSFDDFLVFIPMNSIAFTLSMGVIILMLPADRNNYLLHLSLFFLMMSYHWAVGIISPSDTRAVFTGAGLFSILIFFMIIFVKIFNTALEGECAGCQAVCRQQLLL